MKLRLALAAATCLALPLAAQAQPVKGPYVSLGAGTSLQDGFSYDNHNGSYGKFNTTPSYSGQVSVGYGLGNGFRAEISGNFYRNNISSAHNYGAGNISAAHGGTETYGPMVDVLYDFNVGLPIFPYLGAGAGYQWVHLSNSLAGDGNGYRVGGDAGSFAYQLIAGVSYPLPWVPGLSATAEYRFMQLVSSRNYAEVGGNNGMVKLGQHEYHTFLLGLRYQLFNAPAAAPAPVPVAAPVAAAPAPAPAKTYLVFFDWDKANLTPRATQIISQAASDSKTQNVTTLNVAGYTDTSGTATYNQGLSERRAKAVAAQLVQDGVPASEIEIQAYGATHLLVPTGPGVREPQNRRVEIVLK